MSKTADTNEEIGKLVRDVWVQFCIEKGVNKESHLTPWDDLSDSDKEVDKRIEIAITNKVKNSIVEYLRMYYYHDYRGENHLADQKIDDLFKSLTGHWPKEDKIIIEKNRCPLTGLK
jgi:hypothetical protein